MTGGAVRSPVRAATCAPSPRPPCRARQSPPHQSQAKLGFKFQNAVFPRNILPTPHSRHRLTT